MLCLFFLYDGWCLCYFDYVCMRFVLFLSYPTLSYPTLSYPTLSYPTLSYPTLSYPILPYAILPYPTLSYPTLSYPILSYPILSYPILSSKFYIAHKGKIGHEIGPYIGPYREGPISPKPKSHLCPAVWDALRGEFIRSSFKVLETPSKTL